MMGQREFFRGLALVKAIIFLGSRSYNCIIGENRWEFMADYT